MGYLENEQHEQRGRQQQQQHLQSWAKAGLEDLVVRLKRTRQSDL